MSTRWSRWPSSASCGATPPGPSLRGRSSWSFTARSGASRRARRPTASGATSPACGENWNNTVFSSPCVEMRRGFLIRCSAVLRSGSSPDFWRYVNSWGRDQNTMLRSRVGAPSSGMNFFVKILQIDYRIWLCRFFFLWTDIFALKHQALEMAMFEIIK